MRTDLSVLLRGYSKRRRRKPLAGRPVYRLVMIHNKRWMLWSNYYSVREVGLIMQAFREACWKGDDAFLDALPWVGKKHLTKRPRVGLWPQTRAFVIERDGGRCRRCGATERLQVDHIVAVVHGGSDDPSNLQTLCGPCNRAKGPLAWERRRMAARGG